MVGNRFERKKQTNLFLLNYRAYFSSERHTKRVKNRTLVLGQVDLGKQCGQIKRLYFYLGSTALSI